MTPTLPQIHTFLSEVREVLLSEGLKEVRDPARAQRLNRLWREAGELMKGMGWRPIDTAPRDGTLVDLWLTDQDGNAWREPNAYFVRDYPFETTVYDENGAYKRVTGKRDGWYAPNNDYDGQDGFCDIPRHYNPGPRQRREIFTEPTHWMPLPEPPSS